MHLIINTSKQFHNELSLPRSMYDLFACDNKYLVMTLTLFVSQEVQDLSAELGELSISLCNNPTDQKLTVKINCARALQQITKDGKLSMCFLYEEVFEANSREVDLSSFFLFCFTGVKTDQLFIFSAISGKRIRLYVLLDCFVDYKDKRSYWTIKSLTLICDQRVLQPPSYMELIHCILFPVSVCHVAPTVPTIRLYSLIHPGREKGIVSVEYLAQEYNDRWARLHKNT